MTKTKYMMSGGLAFSEQKDLEKLHKLSLEGWHVRSFSFLGYTLEKGECADYVYSIDYRTLENTDEEYFELFKDAGWSLVDSAGDIHLFRAAPNTKPIYTDRDTTIEKYKNQVKPLQLASLILVPSTIISWMITQQAFGIIHTISFILALLFTVITIPLLWTALTAFGNQWKTENKNGFVIATKLIPAIAVLIAIFALLQSDLKAVQIVAAAVIGATVFVAFISLLMSLYHLIKVRKA
ncbi:hypothetical protein B857_01180 [Solibacillus isronensis B3W22]|uniref:DUF2812 domain-containing protein n=1 Tax=Solibacillus isronensis B3W22 TaxID=1224748 RepID=K1L5Q3_9BACL|nr:DUF2812 domain-containing protein [Solibacillus isronensis]AMO85033.1 hypothetical protein SOLI23_05385 [Solibacillus silvestris]EKB45908.1 hypothetical protein B857_01180 [Solibacillus isronensis B3W22]